MDALSPTLSGIGRYTWELASRLQHHSEIEEICYFSRGRRIKYPESLLREAVRHKKSRINIPSWAKDWYWGYTCHGRVFHGPNYFLPRYAENGVITVHDLSVFKFPQSHPVDRVRIFEESFCQTLKIARHLITDSETTRNEVIDFFDWPVDRITTVHLGVSNSFRPRCGESLNVSLAPFNLIPGKYSLCVSTIEPRKRIDALLTAYRELPRNLRDEYPLVLVGGKGWRSEKLHDDINSMQSEGWLHYLGFVSEAYLPALYAGARMFVYPSMYEGFGLPVVEAMASGVPVVTSDCSCLPEVACGAARLVNPDNVDEFIVGLEEGLTNLQWRKQAAARGLIVAAGYRWSDCVRRTAAVYAEVAAR